VNEDADHAAAHYLLKLSVPLQVVLPMEVELAVPSEVLPLKRGSKEVILKDCH